MTIQLPPHIESSIQAAVQGGHFASMDEAMTEAANLLLERLERDQAHVKPSAVGHAESAQAGKPIWEEILELTAGIPDEELDKLPVDGAEQHDHYIYGVPKRRPTP